MGQHAIRELAHGRLSRYYDAVARFTTRPICGGTTFNFQEQNRWTYEARLTSQGESRLQWMAGAFYEDVWDWWDYGAKVPGLESTAAWYYAEYLAAYYGADVVPLPATDEYYTNVFREDRSSRRRCSAS